ncbi:MAG: hypothetical protein WA323_10840 [Candidatus Nitrosopolaris sp.]|jgi:hypothetical protein
MPTQDASVYLVAITQNMITHWQNKKEDEIQELKSIQLLPTKSFQQVADSLENNSFLRVVFIIRAHNDI